MNGRNVPIKLLLKLLRAGFPAGQNGPLHRLDCEMNIPAQAALGFDWNHSVQPPGHAQEWFLRHTASIGHCRVKIRARQRKRRTAGGAVRPQSTEVMLRAFQQLGAIWLGLRRSLKQDLQRPAAVPRCAALPFLSAPGPVPVPWPAERRKGFSLGRAPRFQKYRRDQPAKPTLCEIGHGWEPAGGSCRLPKPKPHAMSGRTMTDYYLVNGLYRRDSDGARKVVDGRGGTGRSVKRPPDQHTFRIA